MPVTLVTGDILRDRADALLIGMNAAGRIESTAFFTRLADAFPAALAGLRRAAAAGQIQPGMLWLWQAGRPMLGFLIVRETPVGAARPRYVEAAVRQFTRVYRLEGIASAAVGAPGAAHEWEEHRAIIERWLGPLPIPIAVYPPD